MDPSETIACECGKITGGRGTYPHNGAVRLTVLLGLLLSACGGATFTTQDSRVERGDSATVQDSPVARDDAQPTRGSSDAPPAGPDAGRGSLLDAGPCPEGGVVLDDFCVHLCVVDGSCGTAVVDAGGPPPDAGVAPKDASVEACAATACASWASECGALEVTCGDRKVVVSCGTCPTPLDAPQMACGDDGVAGECGNSCWAVPAQSAAWERCSNAGLPTGWVTLGGCSSSPWRQTDAGIPAFRPGGTEGCVSVDAGALSVRCCG